MAALASSTGSRQPPGGSADGGWRAYTNLVVPQFAWEFLRRNPVYRREFAVGAARGSVAIDTRWGLRFPADPDVGSGEADVFWRPEIAPGIVVPLTPNPMPSGSIVLKLPPGRSRAAEEGLHIRLTAGLQVLLRGLEDASGPMAVLLAYDADYGLRVRAAEALDRATKGRPPITSRLTVAQRMRLARCLVALDGRLRGDSYRTIAAALFGEALVAQEAWRTASLRATTIRLAHAGRTLMEGGYLKLLRGGL